MSSAVAPVSLSIAPELDPSPTCAGLIWASGLAPVRAGVELPPSLAAAIARVGGVLPGHGTPGSRDQVPQDIQAGAGQDPRQAARRAGPGAAAAVGGEEPDPWPDQIRERVRRMLRHGRYKPSGRAKPASEFLLRAARAGELQSINGPVDVNNAVSLESGLPASVFDLELCGPALLLRRGLAQERYVFNGAGQAIDLQDLLVVCRRNCAADRASAMWEPCGNPVKDALVTKIRPGETSAVAAVLYAPADMEAEQVRHWAERFATLLRAECGATAAGCQVVSGQEGRRQ